MRLLVCSDSHGDVSSLDDIYLQNPNCDLYIHCGDSQLPSYLTYNYLVVEGNCDYLDYPFERDVKTKFGNIHIEHGNRRPLSEEYIKSKTDFLFLSGHTHCKKTNKIGNIYCFNPGSLTRPRDDNNGSYLIINIDEKTKEVTYQFKTYNL